MTTPTKPPRDRKVRNLRTILIEPFKQIKLGIYVIIVALGFTIVTGAMFVYAFIDQYHHVMEIFQVVDPKFKWEVVTNDVFYTNSYRVATLLATFIVVLFVVVFRSTHKFYGPLVSIERFVAQVAEGDYTKRVVIRRGDELQRLVDHLNVMATRLEERHGQLVDRRSRNASGTPTSPSDAPKQDAS